MILQKKPYITCIKNAGAKAETYMFRLIKYLFILVVLAFIGLVGYAYIGPFFGADFSAPQSETRVPVTLDAN